MKRFTAFIFTSLFALFAHSNECKMHITVTNKTSNSIEAGLVMEGTKNIINKLLLQKNSTDQFNNICKGKYLIIIKDGEEYTETQLMEIKYDVIVEGANTKTSWTNGSAEYFNTPGKNTGANKVSKEKYKF